MTEDFHDPEEYRVNGRLHRTDGPAIIWNNGMQEWWQNGVRHRLDGPAVIWNNGTKEWWQNGMRHRTNSPAILFSDGDEKWYQNNKLHRLDGPAVKINGDVSWYKNGKLHRLNGPAIYKLNDIKYTQRYFIKGKEMDGIEYVKCARKELKRNNDKILLEMMKTTFLALKQSQIDTNDSDENDNYYHLPKVLVASIIEKIEQLE